ncbi:hypothetical protein [Mucilaginibacter sp. UR6-11]|uniref:hypothetical protein n=1 Tax=Mucilaginibacter sp. UR6-11 TaxID=1435644 RepID=UPI001E605D4F|nr:hypothetical protein [Mucilaginibacter sp. UR6-11]MCC8425212.1 hypothetical protein [Mucilaginibacter sp. UR6-11]
MNEQVDNVEYEFLWKLLANPAEPNHSYVFNLQSLVADYPQSGALRALLMPNGDKRNLKHAAAYFNPGILHKLATDPSSLPKVTEGQIIYSKSSPAATANHFNIPAAEPFAPPVPQAEPAYFPVTDDDAAESTTEHDQSVTPTSTYNTFAEQAEEENQPVTMAGYSNTFAEDVYTESTEADSYSEETPAYVEDQAEPYAYPEAENAVELADEADPSAAVSFVDEKTSAPVIPEENELGKAYNNHIAENEAYPAEPVSSYGDERYFHQEIDDEVYDEIVSIEDIGLEQLAILNKSAREEAENTAPVANVKAEENYFVFEPDTTETDQEHTAVTTQSQPAPAAEIRAQNQVPNDQATSVSRYNDEKMPYTFMWWLDKTRKEHANVYQPYVSKSTPVARPKKKPELDELQQQYYQNIVSTTSITDLDKNPPVAAQAAHLRKEDKIIERFIQEEPQIKHPSGIRLDNENKAKRSSEDKEDLVTETLARIYTEQMLYHKAILTYKKLMLKYPEKSLYFAGQIEQLESKIN